MATKPKPSKQSARKPAATPHGGKRPGAGRKHSPASRALAAADQAIAAAGPDCRARVDDLIATTAIELTEHLIRLAKGDYERVKQWRVPAGLVTRDVVTLGADGKPQKTQVSAFPEKPPTELVVIKEQTEWADGDREAGKYLLDRVLGRPKQALELSGEGGGPIQIKTEERAQAAAELAQWRREMTAALSSMPSA